MLSGRHNPKLDEKGRLIFPAKLREDFAGGVVLARGQERCINAYSAEEWANLRNRMAQASNSSATVRALTRHMFAESELETFDGQGRILIAAALRDWAGLDKELVVVGVLDHVEIWDRQAYESYMASTAELFASLDQEVIPGID